MDTNFYQFLDMLNGYSNSMKILTKILKTVFGHLVDGHLLVINFDDSYLQGKTEKECMNNIKVTVDILLKLGLVVTTR